MCERVVHVEGPGVELYGKYETVETLNRGPGL